jgi:signal transduction histidine kinase
MRPAESGALWRAFLVVGCAASVLHFFLPRGGVVQSVLYLAVGAAAAVAIVVGIALRRPPAIGPWVLLALGQLALTLGDGIWIYQDLVSGIEPPFPQVADVVYLTYYPLAAAGLCLFARAGSRRRGWALIDPLIVTVGAAIVAWVFLMAPYARDHSLRLAEQLTSLAYPIGDLLLLSMTMRLVFAPGRRPRAHVLLLASITAGLTADAIYGRMVLDDTYYSGHWIDSVWLIGYVLWGAAALHPSMRLSAVRDIETPRASLLGRLALLGVASLASPAVLIARAATGHHAEEVLIGAGAALLFVLVLIRVWDLLRSLREQAARLNQQGEELREALSATAELRERQERFTAFASHELRWPITGVLGSLVTLRRLMDFEGTEAQRAEMLDTASRHARRLGRLVDDLLAATNAGDEIEVRRVPTSVTQTLGDVLSELAPAARARVRVEVPAGTMVEADPDRLAQAVTNLVNGTLDRAASGEVQIEASQTDGIVRITARATAGLADPLVEQDGTLDWEQLGISMQALRALVEAMGGAVSASGRAGDGIAFSFTLPSAREGAATDARAQLAS